MNRLKKLQNRRAALRDHGNAILDGAAKEERDLNEQERKDFDACMEEIKEVEAGIAREEAIANVERRMQPVRDVNEDTDAERRAREGTEEPKPPQGFRSFGEQIAAVIRAGLPGGRAERDERLRFRAGGTGMNEASPTDGGFLVQKDFEAGLVRSIYETGQLASRVRRRPIGPNSNGLKLNLIAETSRATGSRYGGVQTYWTAEGGLKVPSAPKTRQVDMSLKKLIGLCYLTDELLADTVALDAFVRDIFKEEFGFAVDDAILYGTGAGQPLGISNSGAIVTVAKESGQADSTIVLANVLNMYARMPARCIPNSVWTINVGAVPQLYQMTLGGTAAVPVWLPPQGAEGSPFSTLLGRPVIPIEQASAVGTAGDIMLLDLSQYLMIDKGQVEEASSIHVRFLYDETTLRFVYRCEGQPLWNSPITPYKNSGTQSPFVQLASRP